LQDPVPKEGNFVKFEWFRRYDRAPEKQIGDHVVQSWDTAIALGDDSDYSVCTTWLKKKDDYYLLHVFRDRLNFPDLQKKVISHAREFAADVILIEKAGIGISLLQEFEADRPPRMVRPIGILPKGDKKDRLAAQSPKIEAGHVYLPREAPWLADFLAEVLAFPYTRHDDQIDSLSQVLQWASSWRNPPALPVSLPIYGG
jgi:predicted phage terminase large subunit-like protein